MLKLLGTTLEHAWSPSRYHQEPKGTLAMAVMSLSDELTDKLGQASQQNFVHRL